MEIKYSDIISSKELMQYEGNTRNDVWKSHDKMVLEKQRPKNLEMYL